MKEYACHKCGSTDVFIDERGNQKALMCGDCGAWLKWIGKKEIPLVERYIKSKSKTSKAEALGECHICGDFKKVTEFIKDINNSQQLVLFCDDCLEWVRSL